VLFDYFGRLKLVQIRIPLLYGTVERLDESSVSALFSLVRDRKPVTVDDWQVRYPTHVADVAATFAALVRKAHTEVRMQIGC